MRTYRCLYCGQTLPEKKGDCPDCGKVLYTAAGSYRIDDNPKAPPCTIVLTERYLYLLPRDPGGFYGGGIIGGIVTSAVSAAVTKIASKDLNELGGKIPISSIKTAGIANEDSGSGFHKMRGDRTVRFFHPGGAFIFLPFFKPKYAEEFCSQLTSLMNKNAGAPAETVPDNNAGSPAETVPDNNAGAFAEAVQDNNAGEFAENVPDNNAGTPAETVSSEPGTRTAKFCSYCGTILQTGGNFCVGCGKPLKK